MRTFHTDCLAFTVFFSLVTCSLVTAQPAWEPITPLHWGVAGSVTTNAASNPVMVRDQVIYVRSNGSWVAATGVGAYPKDVRRFPSGTFYARCQEGVFRSVDHGFTWSIVEDLEFPDYQRMTISADAIYTNKGKVQRPLRSTDEGRSWQEVTLIGSGQSDFTYVFAGANSSVVVGMQYAQETPILGVSVDQGRSWQPVSETFGGVEYPSVYVGPSVLYVAAESPQSSQHNLYRSIDTGATWQLVASFDHEIDTVVIPSTSSVFVSFSPLWNEVVGSVDGGNSWTTVMLEDCNQHTVRYNNISLAPDGTVLLSTQKDGLLASSDFGNTWREVGVKERLVTDVIGVGRSLYAQIDNLVNGWDGHAWESTDMGDTWLCLDAPVEAYDSSGAWISSYPTENSTLAIGRSMNRGVSWSDLGPEVDETAVFSPFDPVVTNTGTLLASCYTGATGTVPGASMYSGVLRKERDATEWEWLLMEPSPSAYGLLRLSPKGALYFYLNERLYRSMNDGQVWTVVDSAQVFIDFTIGRDETLYARVVEDGKHVGMRSVDGGNSWQELALPSDSLVDLIAVGTNQVMAIMFSTSNGNYVLFSNNRGESFVSANAGLEEEPLELMCELNGTIFLRTESNYYRSSAVSSVPMQLQNDLPLVLSVQPNPITDNVAVKVHGDVHGNARYMLFSSSGEFVGQWNRLLSANQTVSLDVRSLPSGQYHLEVEVGGRTATTSVIVLR